MLKLEDDKHSCLRALKAVLTSPQLTLMTSHDHLIELYITPLISCTSTMDMYIKFAHLSSDDIMHARRELVVVGISDPGRRNREYAMQNIANRIHNIPALELTSALNLL